MFTNPDGFSGMITTVTVGSGGYVDAGATALKTPNNTALPPVNLTSSIVVMGALAVTTAAPTHPSRPFLISYDVKDTATPPNHALTVRRRVQVSQGSGFAHVAPMGHCFVCSWITQARSLFDTDQLQI